jgi:hypothetical protein
MDNCPICNAELKSGMCIKDNHSVCIGKTSIGISLVNESIYYYYLQDNKLGFCHSTKEYKYDYKYTTFNFANLKSFCETILILS